MTKNEASAGHGERSNEVIISQWQSINGMKCKINRELANRTKVTCSIYTFIQKQTKKKNVVKFN
jgi:hypothetical protein